MQARSKTGSATRRYRRIGQGALLTALTVGTALASREAHAQDAGCDPWETTYQTRLPPSAFVQILGDGGLAADGGTEQVYFNLHSLCMTPPATGLAAPACSGAITLTPNMTRDQKCNAVLNAITANCIGHGLGEFSISNVNCDAVPPAIPSFTITDLACDNNGASSSSIFLGISSDLHFMNQDTRTSKVADGEMDIVTPGCGTTASNIAGLRGIQVSGLAFGGGPSTAIFSVDATALKGTGAAFASVESISYTLTAGESAACVVACGVSALNFQLSNQLGSNITCVVNPLPGGDAGVGADCDCGNGMHATSSGRTFYCQVPRTPAGLLAAAPPSNASASGGVTVSVQGNDTELSYMVAGGPPASVGNLAAWVDQPVTPSFTSPASIQPVAMCSADHSATATACIGLNAGQACGPISTCVINGKLGTDNFDGCACTPTTCLPGVSCPAIPAYGIDVLGFLLPSIGAFAIFSRRRRAAKN